MKFVNSKEQTEQLRRKIIRLKEKARQMALNNAVNGNAELAETFAKVFRLYDKKLEILEENLIVNAELQNAEDKLKELMEELES